MRVTIREIAQIAGVSRGTVDRVINGRPGVKPETRENVLRIIREMNYVPNIAAKALAYSKNPVTIGVIMPSRDLVFFDEIRKGMEDAVSEEQNMGIRVDVRYLETGNPNDAASIIDEFFSAGVSGIMVSIMDHPAIQQKINEAVNRNIPVITFNSDVSNCRRLCFVGQDLYKSGKVAAGLMARVVAAGSKVIALTGNMAYQAHRDRVNGFMDALGGMPGGISVSEVIQGYDRYDDTYRGIRKALEAHGDISGIYMATGHVGACIDAVRELGLAGRIRIICNDLVPDVVNNMKEGIIDFTIVQDPYTQGYKPLKILREYLFLGKIPDSDRYYTEISIKIPENL